MKLKKWLKQTDIISHVVIWTKDQLEMSKEEPIFSGSTMDIPWYLAERKLYKNKKDTDFEAPIMYRDSLGQKYNNRSGFVIIIED